jgi:hypothetical protein
MVLVAGSAAGGAGLLIFLVLHMLWIVPIWGILPIGVPLAVGGGLAVGWADGELRWRLPERPWTARSMMDVVVLILLSAVVLAERHGPVFTGTLADPAPTVAPWVIVARFVGELLAKATIVCGLIGRWIGQTRRAALATGLAGFAFALGPGHNIPLIGGTPGVGKELVMMIAVIGVSALVLVEGHNCLSTRR